LEAEEYKSLNRPQRIEREKQIIERYILTNAPEEINITHKIRNKILGNNGTGDFPIFLEAEAACLNLVHQELWLDWIYTGDYFSVLGTKMERGKRLRDLIIESVDPHVQSAACWVFLNARLDDKLNTKLIKYCLSGDITDVERTISQGADINHLDDDQGSPLMIAIKQMNIVLVNYFIELPDLLINQTDSTGQTPLIIACKLFSTDDLVKNTITVIFKLILNHKDVDVNVYDSTGTTALMYASLVGNIDIVSKLIDIKADVNAKHVRGNTVLHYAVSSENVNIVQSLLDNGARIRKNDSGKTPSEATNLQELKDVLPKTMSENVKKYLKQIRDKD